MSSLIAKPRRREVKNTHKLPTHEPLRRELRDVYREQRNAILRYLRTGQKDDQTGGIPWFWPTWDDFRLGARAISERMTPFLSATWDKAAARFAPRVGLDADEWSVVNLHTERMIQQQAYNFCQSTNDSTSQSLDVALQKLRDALTEGVVKAGEALPELTKRVNQIFNLAEKKKAREIAQTETARAVHSAQEQAAIASGVVTGWRWLASADACDLCLAIVARCPVVKLGSAFAVVGHNPTYQTINFPPAHPHCNCTVTEILDTDPQPTFHPTLDQPEPATTEEVDKIGSEQREQWEDIVRTWDPETGLYGSGPQAPKPKPATLPSKPKPMSFGPTRAEVVVPEYNNEKDINRSIRKVLGLKASLRDAASAAGATDDAVVTIDHQEEGEKPKVYITVISDDYKAYRTIWKTAYGQTVMGADSFYVSEEMKGKGLIGPRVFGRMIEQCVRLGISYIKTQASRMGEDNGYYTWARFGYDADIPSDLISELPQGLASAKHVSDLMVTEEGRQWWKMNGRTIDMTFDLSPGSLSLRIWAAYQAAKRGSAKRLISRKRTLRRLMPLGRKFSA